MLRIPILDRLAVSLTCLLRPSGSDAGETIILKYALNTSGRDLH